MGPPRSPPSSLSKAVSPSPAHIRVASLCALSRTGSGAGTPALCTPAPLLQRAELPPSPGPRSGARSYHHPLFHLTARQVFQLLRFTPSSRRRWWFRDHSALYTRPRSSSWLEAAVHTDGLQAAWVCANARRCAGRHRGRGNQALRLGWPEAPLRPCLTCPQARGTDLCPFLGLRLCKRVVLD